MNLKDAYLRAAVENKEQLEECLKSKVTDLIYIDSCSFEPEEFAAITEKVHAEGRLCGLRMPYIWRTQAEEYFDRYRTQTAAAGFDVFLFRNTESIYYFEENGLLEGVPYITDHSIYVFNSEADRLLAELLPDEMAAAGGADVSTASDSGDIIEDNSIGNAVHRAVRREVQREVYREVHRAGITLPLELNLNELKELKAGKTRELVVYGRAPMMVSDQCVKKTTGGCDHRNSTVFLKDRKGALMPVQSRCRFCFNIILNSVPTVLFDLDRELALIAPDSIRYEFTVEDGRTVSEILSGKHAADSFTRGHLKRGV